MRAGSCCALLILVLLQSTGAIGGEPLSQVELTVAETTATPSDNPAWGWWNAARYDPWQPVEEDETGVVGARLALRGEGYTVLLAGEWYPTAHASGAWVDPAAGPVTDTLSIGLEVYDLALGQELSLGADAGVMPWVGLTYMLIEETRESSIAPTGQPIENADTTLWGAALGLDGEFPWFTASPAPCVSRRVGARAPARRGWCQRRSPPASPWSSRVKVEDDTSRAMYGVELGLRWLALHGVELEAGWRYRDWEYDDGPTSFEGPFLRLRVGW